MGTPDKTVVEAGRGGVRAGATWIIGEEADVVAESLGVSARDWRGVHTVSEREFVRREFRGVSPEAVRL